MAIVGEVEARIEWISIRKAGGVYPPIQIDSRADLDATGWLKASTKRNPVGYAEVATGNCVRTREQVADLFSQTVSKM